MPHPDRQLGAIWVSITLLSLFTLCACDQEKAKAIATCFEGRTCLDKRTAWEHFTEDLPSCLVAARIWWSAKPPKLAVTLVTQLSPERLSQLKAQCETWAGPLAAAVYLPLYNPSDAELTPESKQKLQTMLAHAQELFDKLEATGACQLRLILLYELFADEKALVLYPVNSLRNYARLMADTDLITNIDVDMVPSVSISTALADPATLAHYTDSCRSGAVYVWAAFEQHCKDGAYGSQVVTLGKGDVPRLLKECVRRMRPKAPFSHNATDYARWLEATEAYRIEYQDLYEPWFLSWRWGTHWYDYRFRGYGKNKIVQAAAMAASGSPYFVSTHGFLLHRKHAESRVRKQFLKAKFSRRGMEELKGSVYEHVESLWGATKAELRNGSYVARVERHFQACVGGLPWWQRPGR